MKHYLLCYLLVPLLLLASCTGCTDMDATLPPITSEGKDTFGCKVNGEVWLPKTSFPHRDMYYFENSSTLFIEATHVGKSPGFIYIILDPANIRLNQPIFFSKEQGNLSDYYSEQRPANIAAIERNTEMYSAVNMSIQLNRLDTEVCAGTFEFDVVVAEGDTVNITEGRFDISRDY